MTLPIIYTINNANATTRNYIINAIKKHNTDKKRIAEVIDYVNAHDGIAYTRKVMFQYQSEAIAIIDSISDNAAAQNLKQLVDFVIDRKK